jgi:hypothetical protein
MITSLWKIVWLSFFCQRGLPNAKLWKTEQILAYKVSCDVFLISTTHSCSIQPSNPWPPYFHDQSLLHCHSLGFKPMTSPFSRLIITALSLRPTLLLTLATYKCQISIGQLNSLKIIKWHLQNSRCHQNIQITYKVFLHPSMCTKVWIFWNTN